MSSKKRVYDLAKEYGMSGQEMAAKLREMGFTQVKSHMTALPEADLMLIEGRLDAYGYTRSGGGSADAPAETGGLIVKRKKKRRRTEPEPEAAPAAEDPAEPERPTASEAAAATEEPAAEQAPTAETPAPEAESPDAATPETATPEPEAPTEKPSAEQAPASEAPAEETPPTAAADAAASESEAPAEPTAPAAGATSETPPAAEAPSEPVTPTAEPERPAAEAERPATAGAGETETPAPTAGSAPEPSEAERPAARAEAEAPAETGAAASAADQEAPAAETPAKAPAPKSDEAAGEGSEEEGDIVRPSEKRRQGKVVGFIDLSKIQPDRPARRESRRHRSADDLPAPNVQPTMGRNRKHALSRGGDVQRNDLTAAQLREREAGRFLRRQRPGPGGGGRRGGGGGRQHSGPVESPYKGQQVTVEQPITIKKIAETLSVKANDLLRTAFKLLGFGAVTINSNIDEDTATLLAAEYEVDLEVTREIAAEEALISQLDAEREKVEEEHLELRAPTLAILGHVDHGKTTLIDTIRKSQIAGDESGGITQHIGAYQVETRAGHRLTVVDTPGHAAFTAMRARGADAVDIVVLVVAADDGVKPQTEEAINHAKAAGTPIVVALNKCDKPEAQPDKVMNQLSALELIPEDWGGDTAMMQVSALKGDGIDDLLERVYLEAEVLELQSHPTGPASGVVLEAEIQQGRGIVAHLLIQDGSLQRGDVILAGEGYGRVRSIQNDRGQTIEEAGPSTPIEVSGLDKLPGVGERFHVVPDLQAAKEVAEERAHANRMMTLADRQSVNRENLFEAVAQADKSIINLVVKADVQGSVEVLKAQLAELTHDEVLVKVLHAGVGAIAESDVDLATTSEATIIAFHVGTNTKARQLAERNGVEIRNYQVIYEVLDDVRKMMEGQLSPDISEEVTGHAEIRRIFRSSKIGNIAGCMVLDGKIIRDSKLRLLRDGNVVHTGELGSLRRETDDVKEVREGFECGIVIKNYNDIQEGDVVEAYRLVETKRTI